MTETKKIQQKLFELQDLKYKEFQCKLMPTVGADTVIGVRTPALRTLAKELFAVSSFSSKSMNTAEISNDLISEFLGELPHQYYEENNLHGYIIEHIKAYDLCIAEVKKFVPHINNWATCDTMRPKCFKKNTEKLFFEIEKWLASDDVYTVRYGIGMLLSYYLDEHFEIKYLDMVTGVISKWNSNYIKENDETQIIKNQIITYENDLYYIYMMATWYFATALAKQYDSTIIYLQENKLPLWVHNKTIQKAIESYRILPEQKEYLRTLRRK